MTRDKVRMKVRLQDTSKREVPCLKVLRSRGGGGKRGGEKREEGKRKEKRK